MFLTFVWRQNVKLKSEANRNNVRPLFPTLTLNVAMKVYVCVSLQHLADREKSPKIYSNVPHFHRQMAHAPNFQRHIADSLAHVCQRISNWTHMNFTLKWFPATLIPVLCFWVNGNSIGNVHVRVCVPMRATYQSLLVLWL